jgi:hypothetical protein
MKPDGGWACFETHAPKACPVSTPVDSIVDRCSIALCRSIGREYCCLLADSFDHDVGSVRSDGRRRKMCFCYLMLGSCYRACNRTKVPTYIFLDFLCVVKLQKNPFRSRVHLGQATSKRRVKGITLIMYRIGTCTDFVHFGHKIKVQ